VNDKPLKLRFIRPRRLHRVPATAYILSGVVALSFVSLSVCLSVCSVLVTTACLAKTDEPTEMSFWRGADPCEPKELCIKRESRSCMWKNTFEGMTLGFFQHAVYQRSDWSVAEGVRYYIRVSK